MNHRDILIILILVSRHWVTNHLLSRLICFTSFRIWLWESLKLDLGMIKTTGFPVRLVESILIRSGDKLINLLLVEMNWKMVTITMVMELAMEVVVFSINLVLPCREMHQVWIYTIMHNLQWLGNHHIYHINHNNNRNRNNNYWIKFTLKENLQLDSLRNHHH